MRFPELNGEYTVAIITLTYNHSAYIESTIRGFISQKTKFPVVALILDDCSTDGTADIIRKYEEMHPDLIKGIYFDENQYSQGKRTFSYLFPYLEKTKYCAFCEGDDYWTDPLKLQKQVDFMESHSDCSMSFHSVMEHWQDGCTPDKVFFPVKNKVYTGTEIYKQWVVATCSVMICSSVFRDSQMLDLFKNKGLMYYDQALFIYCAIVGKARGMSDVMGVYRRLKTGYTSNLINSISPEVMKRYCDHNKTIINIFGSFLGDEFIKEAKNRYVASSFKGFFLSLKNGFVCLGLKCLMDAFTYAPKVSILCVMYNLRRLFLRGKARIHSHSS